MTLALKDKLYIKAHGIILTGDRFLSPNKQPEKMNFGTRTSLPEQFSYVYQELVPTNQRLHDID